MSTRVTLLMQDLDAQIGRDAQAVQGLLNIAAAFDTQGALPEPEFIRVTPNVRGHGELWFHSSTGLYVMRTEHRPILLTNERCATCQQAHVDACHMYLMMSPADFENRAYMRYASTPVELGQSGSTSGGA